jgi:DNA polymerase elongation subunit (family B)
MFFIGVGRRKNGSSKKFIYAPVIHRCMELRFYLLEADYKVVGEKPVIQLYGRTTDGKQICVVDEGFEPYFWVINEKDALARLEKLSIEQKERKTAVIKTELHQKNFLGKSIEAIKAYTRLPADIPVLREQINFAQCLEADVPFAKRYLIDKKITPLCLCEAKGEFLNQRLRIPVFKAESVVQVSDDVASPNMLAFDIETRSPLGKIAVPEQDPIIMLAFYRENFQKVITWKKFKTNLGYVEFVNSEAELIERFKETIEEQKPDIVCGYFSDGFDMPYIKARAEKYKINLDVGLDYSGIRMRKGRIASASITGITHIDIFRFVKQVIGKSLETTLYDLNSVAAELLEEEKEKVDLDQLPEAWEKNTEQLEAFCKYNLQDAYLTYKLTEKLMPNMTELVKIVGLPLFDASRMSFSQLVESHLITQAQRFNELIPNKPSYEESRSRRTRSYTGAFVYEPKPGLYKDVVVFDFRSLYPSIISAHNVSPDTLNCECCPEAEPAPGEQSRFCRKKKGFIAAVIEDIINRRMRIKEIIKKGRKDKMLDARQDALKTIANAMYGYMGFFAARWYCLECVKSITAYGRHYIHKVIDKAKKKFNVLYADTDSVFMTLDGKKRGEVEKFIDTINMELPGLMELEYEGLYPAGIFVSTKEKSAGAKKKYALMTEEGSIKIKGFETVRRNLSLIAKETQEKVLNIILKESNVKKAFEYTGEVISKLRNREVPLEKVIIHTQLQKEITTYDAIGPHVAIAQRMREEGKPIGAGSLIKYVVVQGKERIRDRARLPEEVGGNNYDAEYYIHNQVLPAVEKIFEVLGMNINELLEEKKQSKLSKFW